MKKKTLLKSGIMCVCVCGLQRVHVLYVDIVHQLCTNKDNEIPSTHASHIMHINKFKSNNMLAGSS